MARISVSVDPSYKLFLWILLAVSVGCTAVLICRILKSIFFKKNKLKNGINDTLVNSFLMIASVWALRFAVASFGSITEIQDRAYLDIWEECFNSILHALQTVSMDEDYAIYIIDGKQMMQALVEKDGDCWSLAYSIYASVLNVLAPIAGGAILLELFVAVVPSVRLFAANWFSLREKFFFSQLNPASLALAESVYKAKKAWTLGPVFVFANVTKDGPCSHLIPEAKRIGAICMPCDLDLMGRNVVGNAKYFLINEDGKGNLQVLINLSDKDNYKKLKNAEIFMFAEDDAYVEVEHRVKERLSKDWGFAEDEMPVFVPVMCSRNLVTNLLVKVPLYEPLINKPRNDDGTVDLSVTILGTGRIGTEMFLNTYWMGQMLDCNLTINVVSQEPESGFRGRINYINPEILATTEEKHEILRITKQGAFAAPYCKVNYLQADVRSADFVNSLVQPGGAVDLSNTDYFFVALGADEENLSVANSVRRYVGQRHIERGGVGQTVIAYIVYDSELANTLNLKQKYCSNNHDCDIYMCAVGSLREVYSVRNVFMPKYELTADKVHESYLDAQGAVDRADVHKKRMKDDYKHWANLARALHGRYRLFSMGLIKQSLFEAESADCQCYQDMMQQAVEEGKRIVSGNMSFGTDASLQEHMTRLHRLAWVEHRRWCAFTRVKGFRHTEHYAVYGIGGQLGSYKQMDLRLHPCLVECDQNGIRGTISPGCEVDKKSLFQATPDDSFDLLDLLSYDLKNRKFNDFDFKMYDYPSQEF